MTCCRKWVSLLDQLSDCTLWVGSFEGSRIQGISTQKRPVFGACLNPHSEVCGVGMTPLCHAWDALGDLTNCDSVARSLGLTRR